MDEAKRTARDLAEENRQLHDVIDTTQDILGGAPKAGKAGRKRPLASARSRTSAPSKSRKTEPGTEVVISDDEEEDDDVPLSTFNSAQLDDFLKDLDAYHPTANGHFCKATELPKPVLDAIRSQLQYFACGKFAKKSRDIIAMPQRKQQDKCVRTSLSNIKQDGTNKSPSCELPTCGGKGFVCVRKEFDRDRPILIPLRRTEMAGEEDWANPAMWTSAE